MAMNIAITGSHGFVGKNLVERLKDKHKVYEFNRGDELDLEFIHTVIHLACDADSRNSTRSFPDSVENNIGIFTDVLGQAVRQKVKRFIYISSIEAETVHNVYSLCKATNEKLLRMVAEENKMEYVILRPCNLYGKYMDLNDPRRNVVANFLKAIKEHKKLPIMDGTKSHPFTYVQVLIDNIELSLTENTNQTIRVGSTLYIPIYDLATLLEGITTTWDWMKNET
jgi:nucleoside-diphosphate-sugar epimerase